MPPAAALSPAPGVLVEVLDGEAVLLALPDRTLTRLDSVGTAVWELLAAGTPVADAAAQLAERYGAPPEQVHQDVSALADRLLAEGLLVHGLTAYRAVDWSFAVEADAPVVAEQVRRALVDLERPGPPEHRYLLVSPAGDEPGTLHVDDEELARSASESLLYRTLLWHVNRGVADSGGRFVLLHASAVADDAGRAAVMAAPMESGKTTLAAGLVRSGLAYLTDETVALDPETHRLTAYPKPLSVDDGSWDVLAELRPDLPAEAEHLCAEQWQVAASTVGRVATTAEPALVVLPRYEAGSALRVDRLSPADALVELLHSTFAPERAPERDFRSLAALCRRVPAVRLVNGDLDEAVTAVRDLLADALPA